jgi:hypothetical protein
MARPPRAHSLRQLKSERSQTGREDRLERQSGLRLAESRVGQRERERERRVSDADASYNATTTGARTPKHVIPKRNHAKKPTLSQKTSRSLSQGPVKNMLVSTTKTDPDPTLCPPASHPGRGVKPQTNEIQALAATYHQRTHMSSPLEKKSSGHGLSACHTHARATLAPGPPGRAIRVAQRRPGPRP